MAQTTKKYREVIEAFKNSQPLRTRKVKITAGQNGWTYHSYDYEGVRDEVKVENGVTTYYLWGAPIAIYDGRILTFDSKGHRTLLTQGRMNSILSSVVTHFAYWRPWIAHKARGFYFLYYSFVTHPFPLQIDVKQRRIVSEFDKEIYLQKLLRSRDMHYTSQYLKLCKTLKIPIPKDIRDKITERKFKEFLRAA